MVDCAPMPSSTLLTATLLPHPQSRGVAARSIRARLARRQDGLLTISYVIEGDMSRMTVPALASPSFAEGLWKHTCCECFIAIAARPEYCELNFSPSGEWAAYAFSSYREGRPLRDEILDPRIAVRRFADRLELEGSIALARLAPDYRNSVLALGLSAVIEDADGALSYWALAHPAAKPDFHHREAFSLKLEPEA